MGGSVICCSGEVQEPHCMNSERNTDISKEPQLFRIDAICYYGCFDPQSYRVVMW